MPRKASADAQSAVHELRVFISQLGTLSSGVINATNLNDENLFICNTQFDALLHEFCESDDPSSLFVGLAVDRDSFKATTVSIKRFSIP